MARFLVEVRVGVIINAPDKEEALDGAVAAVESMMDNGIEAEAAVELTAIADGKLRRAIGDDEKAEEALNSLV